MEAWQEEINKELRLCRRLLAVAIMWLVCDIRTTRVFPA